MSSPFDDAFLLEADDLAAEMGEDVVVNGHRLTATVSDFTWGSTVQAMEVRVGAPGLSIFLTVAQVAACNADKGQKVRARNRDARVISYNDLGGAGWELLCGPLTGS
jgi:hypothetical protein